MMVDEFHQDNFLLCDVQRELNGKDPSVTASGRNTSPVLALTEQEKKSPGRSAGKNVRPSQDYRLPLIA